MRVLSSLSPTLPLSRQSGLLFCLFAGCFELLAYAASDMVMPAMPAMVDEMGADALHVPLSLVLYLLGGVLVQWIAGPLSDDIGRRPVMLGGAVLFVLASLALSMAPDIMQFHGWRLLQGGCLGIVVAVAYPAVQEAFEQSQALRVTSLLANIALLSPLLAPLAGVALLTQMDWRTLFLWQTGLALAVTAGLFLSMPETVGVTRGEQEMIPRSRMSLGAIWRDYLGLLQHRNFMACTVAIGLIGAPVVAWIGLSPLLLMRHLGLDGWHYALMQLPVFGALITGNLFLFRLAGRRDLAGLLRFGTWPLAAGALIAGTAVLAPLDDVALILFVTGLSVYCFGIGIVNTCLYRLALFTPDSGTGTCAAMLGTITVLLFCLCGMLFQFVGAAHQPAYFGMSVAALGTLSVVVLLAVQRQFAKTSLAPEPQHGGHAMNVLPEVAALCALESAYLPPEQSHSLFHAAMLALTRYHQQHTPGYQRWLAQCGVEVESLRVLGDWRQLPPLHARYLKQYLPLSSEVMTTTELHSSGTSGQKSRMHYDEHSLQALMSMSDRVFEHYGWHTPEQPCNYLLLSYEAPPSLDTLDTLGNARTNHFLCKYAPAARSVYALRATGSGHEFDPYGVIRALQEFAEEGLPVRILGFPSFLWFTLERMQALGLPSLELHPDSLVLLGGGWKLHAAREISKALLYQRTQQQLGIVPQRCRDGYGAVEHGVPYIECEHHHFHVPTYARACVRDTRSMQLLGYDQPGLLHLMSPYIMSCPVHSVVLGDLATMMPADQCGCGIATDCFVLHGRAGTSAQRNCAIAASELIS